MKALFVGDPHLKISQVIEAEHFKNQLVQQVENGNYDFVVLAGDLFDTFAIVRAEILSIWNDFFKRVSGRSRIYVLVGNHDMAGADGGATPLEVFRAYPNVIVVDTNYSYLPNSGMPFLFVPFMRDNAKFEEMMRNVPPGFVVFCHQSFNGAQFENGFYDPHGADPQSVAHLKLVISGHVHKQQRIANIWYPGTPFQHTFSDAGEQKAIFDINFNLSTARYNIEKAHVLDMPTFEVLSAESVSELQDLVAKTFPSPKTHYKFVAKGTPSEIAQFWESTEVKAFKSNAKRVVDALTSMKPITAFVSVKGQTQSEKLDGYIKQRTWRTDADQLARRAREFLTS